MPAWSNNTGGNVTFTGRASGPISIKMFPTLNKACYIQSITVTYEEGATGQTDPRITVTPNPLNIDDDGGVFTVSAANMPNNGLGVGVDSSSPSNAFSFTNTDDNTFNDQYDYFPLTGNANNKYDLESGTVQVNYTGHALSAAGVIKFESGSESATADVKYLYDGDIYIVGDVEGSGWSTEGGTVHGVPLVKNADGTYSVTVTATAGGEGFSWLYFTKSIDAPNYYALGDNRFGPVSNDLNWPFTDNLDGVYCDLDTYGNLHTIKMSPGQYTITINPATNKFKIEEYTAPVSKIYRKVTNRNQMVVDKKYIFVYGNYAMGAISSGVGAEVSITNNDVTVDIGNAAVEEFTLGQNIYGHYTFKNDYYLTGGTGNNNGKLYNTATSDDNGWNLTDLGDGFGITSENSTNSRGVIHRDQYEFRHYTKKNAEENEEFNFAYLYVEDNGTPIVDQVATPSFSPAAGDKDGVVDVTISCSTPDATIHYTVDGTDPTTSSEVYRAPIHVTATTTIKAIAVKADMDDSEVATAQYNLPQSIATIPAANALDNNDKFIFTGSVVVTYSSGKYTWLRDVDATAGGGVHNNNNNITVPTTQGAVWSPEWSATKKTNSSGRPQFENAQNVNASTLTASYAPFDRTGVALTDAHMSEYIKINNVKINEFDNEKTYLGSYNSGNRDVVNYTLYNYFNITGIEVGKTYNIIGVVTRYDDNAQVYPTAIELVKQDPGLAFSEETVNATFGADFTEPELTKPEGVTVKYSSNNTEVAEVNETTGEVTIKKIGNAKITATSVENEYYTVGTASYNIVVSAGTPTFAYSADAKEVVFGAENPELPTLNNPNGLTVTYTSSNPAVATVNENGEVSIVGIGQTTITATGAATGNYAGAEAQYTLTVTAATPTFAYSADAKEVVFGAENPELPTLNNPNGLTVTYTSSNPAVATVNENGEVSIVGIGQTTITATGAATGNYAGAEAQYTLTVTAATPTFAYSAESKEVVFGTENPELPTLSNPNGLTVTYTSSKPEVATVATDGKVTIVGVGETTITATGAATGNYNGAIASYTLTVNKADLEVSFNNETPDPITIGDSFTAPVLSEVPEGTTVTYKSSNPAVATVDPATGVVTIVGPGTAKITATVTGANYNETSASYTITVNDVVVNIAKPTFAPAAGTYTEAKEVAIACATPGVTIEYSINGGETQTYTKPFLVSENCTVTATAKMGTRTVYTPATSEATYTINAASAATIADDYYFLQSNADEVSGKYANVAGRRTLNFVADADTQAGTVFRIETGEGGAVKTLRSQAVDLQGYANRAMAYVPKAIELVLSTLNNASDVDDATGAGNILGENGVQLILKKFYDNFDHNLYVEQGTEGTYRIYGRTPSMQHVVDFYHENTAQVEEKLPMLEDYINQVLDKIRSKIPAPYDANVVVPFSLKTVRDRIADKYGISLIDPTQDLMGFYRQVLNNKEYVWDFAYQTAMMYVDVIKQTGTYQNLDPEYKLFVEKMEKVRPDTKYYIIERGNELDYISENNTEIINNDPRTLWTLTKRENFTVNVPETNKLNDSYYTTLYTDFGYELPTGVNAYAVTGIDENDVAQLTEITGVIPAQTPVLLKADAAGGKVLTLKTDSRGGAIEGNLLEGPDYLITKYQIKTPAVVSLFNMAQGFVPADVLADYEYLQLRYSGTVNNKYFWNVNSDLEDLQGDCVVRSLAVKDGTLAFSEHWTTETNKAFLVSDTKPVIYLEKETLAAPTFSPVPGSYTVDNGQNVTITITAEDDATIKYSTDGGKTWNTYEGPIAASDDMTIVAKAEKDGMIASDEVTAVYVIDNPAELPDVPVMKGYFQIKNKGNEKYAHVQGRKTLTFTDAPADKAGTVIWLETNNKGQVQSLRSQAADLQRYADRVVEYYVPKAVELVVEKLHADGAGNILGENGLDAIMEKFNESFDHHLYVEQAGDDWRLYGKTPSMQPVVEFYREHTAQVEAKLPMLESFINSALDKLKQTIGGGGTIFQPFSLLNIWERMGGTLTKPEDDASIMAFYREVLNNKNYVWDFAYQTATFYLENLKSHQRWPEVEAMMGEYAQYFNKLEQVRPDFKYYIVADGEKPDFISEGNVDIINDAARTIWTVEPRTTFTVNITGEQFGCPLATNGVGGYFTTNYTDFAYTLPEGVTAYKVTGVNDEGEATLEALSGTIPAQTPVLLVAKEEGDYALILSTEADTPVENNLLVGPDYLINKYDFKTEQVQSIFDLIKDKLGESFYNNYVAQYEYLADLNSGTVNNKYFWSVDNYLDDLQGDCVVRSLATDENGKLAFSEHWKTETNKAFLVSDTFDVITLPSFERGDVNHDGEINIKDVSDLIDRLLGNEANSCPYCSDVNCDDDVNIKDVSDLIDFLLNSGADTHVDTPTTDPEEGDGN